MLKQTYDDICARLCGAGIETPELEARLILEKRAGVSWGDIIAQPDSAVAPIDLIEKDVQARIGGMPLSRLYGVREFWGLDFMLSPDTLDPRPDSETLIEAVINTYNDSPPRRILDLGTGTGCLLLSLLHEFPETTGVGIDLSDGAVQTATKNAAALGLEKRATFRQENWCEGLDESFDLVISNPPYITNQTVAILSPEVQNHDPILALQGGKDGLQAYREIFFQIKNILTKEAKIFLEIGFDQKNSVTRLAEESGFIVARAFCDIGGRDRVLNLVENRADGDK